VGKRRSKEIEQLLLLDLFCFCRATYAIKPIAVQLANNQERAQLN